MSNDSVKGRRTLSSANTSGNASAFVMEKGIRRVINTADIVRIDFADQPGTEGPTGYAAATPLVCMIDGNNNTIQPTRIAKLPVFRPQAGKAAIIMDPQPNDKALAVFAKHDSTVVKTGNNAPVQPGSFRNFDMADGFLLNGFLGETPEIWLKLDPKTGDISLSTKAAKIDISCREQGDIEIKTGAGSICVQGTDTVTVKSPQIVLDGNVRVTGNMSVEGTSTGVGGGPAVFSKGIINTSGGITNTGGVVNSNGIVLDTHTHSGIYPGGGNSGSPNTGA